MRRARLFLAAPLTLAALALALASSPGCQDATQVTLEISLSGRASCTETNGTAITVGGAPLSAEQRVTDEYVTATTTACDVGTRQVGTLVLTPGENGRASLVVVVSYDKTASPSSCKPPLFKGCIVARRQVAFTDHRNLHLPVTIDPDCKDVPCDAFSTCRTGKCFSSDTLCDGDSCVEPGDPGDGGTSVDGQVVPHPDSGGGDGAADGAIAEGGTDSGTEGGGTEGGTDAGTDGATDGGPGNPAAVYCDASGNLLCPGPGACNTGSSCCGPQSGATATCAVGSANSCLIDQRRYCCSNAPCTGGKVCIFGAAADGGILPPIMPIQPGGAQNPPKPASANGAFPAGGSNAGICSGP